MLIAFTGAAGCGKSTAADYLADVHGFDVIALATPLKEMVGTLFDFDSWQLYGPSAARNAPDPRYPRADGTCLTPREALQVFGTNAGRKCWPLIWTVACMRLVDANTYDEGGQRPTVIPDARFDEEVAAIRQRGGLVIKLHRGSSLSGAAAQHASEAGVSEQYITHHIQNHGSKEELYAALDAILNAAIPAS